MPLFSTWIYLCRETGSIRLNERLEELTRRLLQDDRNAARRTNSGGWHYAFDLFELNEPVIAEFRDEMEQHVQTFLNHFRPEGGKKVDRFRLRGWINVNRAGDFNVLHCHPGCFLSAVYYVKVPQEMIGGEIAFRDPRGPVVAMYETPGIDLPWVGSGMGIPFTPTTGQLLIFPAWLEHRVERFEGATERISIAFNVTNP
ncbi:MAG TPA: TIGR02466 family protein [Verrucomicrobiae bacterium]|nr:TIGR02466 family protein [Verrucomicrobiae bacterium]